MAGRFNQLSREAVRMLQHTHHPAADSLPGAHNSSRLSQDVGGKSFEARVKPDCSHLYPVVDPGTWYRVLEEGEYRDEMAGLWIQVNDWVTYVLAKHFDLQARLPVQ